MSLSLDRIVDVNVSVSPLAQQQAGFGLINIIGISDVIPFTERFRIYNDIDGVAGDFPTTTEEYKAAAIVFSQIPRPDELMISRRANVASSAELIGGANAEADFEVWKLISDGAYSIPVDGTPEDVTPLDFSLVASMSDVAGVINTAFSGAVTWDEDNTRFINKTASTGITATIGFATAPGAGTDVSGLMDCLSTGGGFVSNGVDIETISESLQAIQDKTDASATMPDDWYHFGFTKEVRDNDEALEAAAWAEPRTKLYWDNSSDGNCAVGSSTTDIMFKLNAFGYNRSESTFDNDDDYPGFSAAARISTVDYGGTNTTITLMFKQLPGITPSNLNSGQANSVEGKKGNYYNYFADTRIYLKATVASGRFVDEIIILDAWKNALQVGAYNYIYQAATKIPQTNAGMTGLVQVCEAVCQQFVRNGSFAPGQVTIDNTTRFLEKGFEVVAQRVEDQDQGDREAREAPPIGIIAKGAGALQGVTINAVFVR